MTKISRRHFLTTSATIPPLLATGGLFDNSNFMEEVSGEKNLCIVSDVNVHVFWSYPGVKEALKFFINNVENKNIQDLSVPLVQKLFPADKSYSIGGMMKQFLVGYQRYDINPYTRGYDCRQQYYRFLYPIYSGSEKIELVVMDEYRKVITEWLDNKSIGVLLSSVEATFDIVIAGDVDTGLNDLYNMGSLNRPCAVYSHGPCMRTLISPAKI